jgi:transposase
MDISLNLPDDIAALKELILLQHREISRLEHNNRLLAKMIFGPSSERRAPTTDASGFQGHLFVKEIAAEASQMAEALRVQTTVEIPAHQRRAAKRGRRTHFPEHLPRVRTVYELAESDRRCACGGELEAFGEEVSRELERIETTVVHEIARKKYACAACHEGVVTAPWRGKVIEKGLLGPGFLAHVIAERFGNHLPYYRLQSKYRGEGLELSRSVLCESTARCADLLEPIAEEIQREVLSSPVIHTDDTPVTIAHSREGGSRQGRVWIYLNREGRHWYEFTTSRKRDGPMRVLRDFRGFLQADAYGGYDGLFVPGGAVEVACWAHARRKFIDAEPTDPELSKAAVDRIRLLFQIEETASDLADDERQALRQEKARPLIDEFEAWVDQVEMQVLPKSPLAKAIGYVRNQRGALRQYLEDGRLSISNNAAERAMRPFAIGRKNWLFFQREGGGKTASILMSLLMTAKAAGVEPREYFRDVLLRISTCKDVRQLTPHGWKTHFEPEVHARRDEILNKLVGNPA